MEIKTDWYYSVKYYDRLKVLFKKREAKLQAKPRVFKPDDTRLRFFSNIVKISDKDQLILALIF